MNEITLKEALLKAFEAQDRERAARSRRYARTPECPPLVRFFSGAFSGWTPSEREHVASCPYCQRTIGQVWIERSPGLGQFALYLLAPGSFPDREAMHYYLSRTGGRLESLMQSLLHSRGLPSQAADAAATTLSSVSAAFGPLPAAPQTLASASQSEEPEILLERRDAETGLAFGLRTDRGMLYAFVRRISERATPSRYHFWIYGPVEPFQTILDLRQVSESVSALGSSAALLPQIGTDCLIILEATRKDE